MTQAKRKRELGGFKGAGMVSEWRCTEGFKEDKALDGRSEEREGLWRVTLFADERASVLFASLQLTQRLQDAPDVWPLFHRQRN